MKRTNTQNFIDTIHSQLEALANTKGLGIEITKIDVPEEIAIDPELLNRAIMNLYQMQSTTPRITVRFMNR